MQVVNNKWNEVLTNETIAKIEDFGTLKFTAYQIDEITRKQTTGIELEFDNVPDFEGKKSKICGTILNELFAWVEYQKANNAKGLKLNMPINIKFEVQGVIFDSGRCRKSSQDTLKLQNNPKGRKRYAQKFWNAFTYATHKVEVKDVHEMINGLEQALTADINAA